LRLKGSALAVQADGQPEFEMGHDSAGDFYPLKFDGLLRPKRRVTARTPSPGFSLARRLRQSALVQQCRRSGGYPLKTQLKEYEGNYPLSPTFAVRVFSTGPKLLIQGTNQGPLEVAAIEKDFFVAEGVGAEIDFERDASDKVIALTLKQGGQVLRGDRH